MREKFSTAHEAHHEEDFLLSLKDVMHPDKKWMISLKQNILLQLRALNLIIIDDYILSKRLHSVNLERILFLYQEYFAETSSTDDLLDGKIGEAHLRISFFGVESFCRNSSFVHEFVTEFATL